MFDQFLSWWVSQLRDLVPAGLTEVGAPAADALIVDIGTDGSERQVWIRRNRRETGLGAVGLAELARAGLPQGVPSMRRATLRVPPAMLLEKEIVLPAAVAADWRNVLRYEMPRVTPFAADQVYWTGAIAARDPVRGRMTLRLSIVPKAPLAGVVAALAQAGLVPGTIEVPVTGGSRSIGIGTAAQDGWRDNAVRALAGACAGLAVVAVILPFVIQAHRLAVTDRRIASLRPVAARAAALQRTLSAGSSRISVIARERLRVGDPVTVLAAVTQALPNNTYLTEFTLRHLHLDFAGRSANAAPLLAALSADPVLRKVAFSAPVTRDTTDHTDLFAIKALIVPSAAADMGAAIR